MRYFDKKLLNSPKSDQQKGELSQDVSSFQSLKHSRKLDLSPNAKSLKPKLNTVVHPQLQVQLTRLEQPKKQPDTRRGQKQHSLLPKLDEEKEDMEQDIDNITTDDDPSEDEEDISEDDESIDDDDDRELKRKAAIEHTSSELRKTSKAIICFSRFPQIMNS